MKFNGKPSRVINITSSRVYQEDLDYLTEKEIPLNRILKEVLHEYVLMHKAGVPRILMSSSERTAAERSNFILKGILPDGTKVKDQEPAVPIVEIRPVPVEAVEPAPADIDTWTKEQRDTWILKGERPAMMGSAPRSRIRIKA